MPKLPEPLEMMLNAGIDFCALGVGNAPQILSVGRVPSDAHISGFFYVVGPSDGRYLNLSLRNLEILHAEGTTQMTLNDDQGVGQSVIVHHIVKTMPPNAVSATVPMRVYYARLYEKTHKKAYK